MKRVAFLALLGTTALAPAVGLAQTTAPAQPAPAAQGAVCQDLVTFLERRGDAQPASPVTLDQARGFVRANDTNGCRDALVRIRGANIELPANLVAVVQAPAGQQTAQADTSRITVQQTAPTVRVEQAAPQVQVQQTQPNVTVRQPMPEILVRQAPPTIRVEQPQPEIIVRMPEPQVNVAMAPPQVSVNTPQPQVQVVQPQTQPQVQVQREQPTVNLQQAQGQANVQIQREGQPQVRYERTGEPQVVYQQAEGQPQIRFEQAGPGAQATQGAQDRPAQPAPAMAANNAATATAPAANTTGAVGPATGAASANTRQFAVSQMKDMDVYNLRGNKLGDVNDVLVGPNNQTFVVVEYGGFLGIGERKVMLPLDRLALQNDRLIIPNMTEDQLKALPAFREGQQGYRAAENTFRTDVQLNR